FAKFIEVHGEDKETIKAKIIEIANKHKQDPCLMLAIAQRESRFFPYAVSRADARGLFQLSTIATQAVQETFFKEEIGKEVKHFNIDQNIEFGILYFKYLKEKYKDSVDSLKKCLAAWNGGEGKVSEGKFQEKQYFKETRDFIRDVLDFQNKCNLEKKQSGKISLAFVLTCLDVVLIWSCLVLTLPYFLVRPLPEEYKIRTILSEQLIDVDGDGVEEKLLVACYKPFCNRIFGMSQVLLANTNDIENFVEIPGWGPALLWLKTGDFNQNGKVELLVDYDNHGNAGFKTWYLYEWRDDHFEPLLEKTEVLFDLEVKDTDNDDMLEIIQTFWPYKEPKVKQIFKWDNQTQEYFLQQTIETGEF
ncbi:transglycosylase SLT domain-containing protein, partial [Candidatus Parcubacteria bacterium]|nr:transglycosylase SLT domain-containing protein [Candidatus Parcubacteria bacterium]